MFFLKSVFALEPVDNGFHQNIKAREMFKRISQCVGEANLIGVNKCIKLIQWNLIITHEALSDNS